MRGWLARLFATYGLPALLTLAVLPAYHSPQCGCTPQRITPCGALTPNIPCKACYLKLLSPQGQPSARVSVEQPVRIRELPLLPKPRRPVAAVLPEPCANAPPTAYVVST